MDKVTFFNAIEPCAAGGIILSLGALGIFSEVTYPPFAKIFAHTL
jgi:hypothetical protein